MKRHPVYLTLIVFLLLTLAGSQAVGAPVDTSNSPSSSITLSPVAFLDFENANDRSRMVQIGAVAMCLALFIIMRNKH